MNNPGQAYECRCSGCFGVVTFRGEIAEVMRAEPPPTRVYCDETCQRGSGVRFKWMPHVDSQTLQHAKRTVVARRKMAAEGRR